MAKRRRVELESDYTDSEDEFSSVYNNSDIQSDSEVEPENETETESESDTEDIDVEAFVNSFNFKLRKWAVSYNITLMALCCLLKLLREQGHMSLPKDARTLLETPRTVNVSDIGNGKFWYRSLKDKLTEVCKIIKCPSMLELGIHCDGFPPYKSSKLEFWPIQVWIKGVRLRPFFVALHFGSSKPSSLELFLRPFINELLDLLKNGLKVKTKDSIRNFVVKIHQMIFDAPARAFLKCIIGHSGYWSCERCEEEGEYLCQPEDETNKETTNKKGKSKQKKKSKSGHVCLIGTDAPLRTDGSFRTKQQEEHHTGTSPLEDLPIDMIRCFPLEYLHLICLGIMKKLTLYWINGTKNYKTKFSALDMKQISEKLIQSRETKPSEINRPSRPLGCASFWKATEFRTFLFKLGPVVLREHLTEEAYNHFLALFCATTICSNKDFLQYVDVARQLFLDFNKRFGHVYGHENYCYTVHSLIHVTDDVKEYGVLDNYSAFKGESNLAFLKSLIRGGYKPLQQIVKRIQEREAVEKWEVQIPENLIELKNNVLTLPDLRLDASEKNGWILTRDHRIFKIERLYEGDGSNIQMQGYFLDETKKKDLFHAPIQSSKLLIYVSTMKKKESAMIDLNSMHCKLWKIHVSDDEYAFFPLFHFTQ